MNIEIKRLSPHLVDDYLHFFDVTPHTEKPDNEDCKCYCVWWCGEDQNNEVFEKYLSTKEKRRDYARDKIIANKIKGYLAYCDNKVVGWCNANTKSDCYSCFCWRNFMGEVHKETPNQKIKSILCFAIAPEIRGKGVATKLLEQVCIDAKIDGFDFVEGYPNDYFLNQAEDYMGPVMMYKNLGFGEYYHINKKIVMRKKL